MTRRRILDDDQRTQAGAVWETYRPFVESVARQHLRDWPDAVPDVVQQVGLQLCRKLDGFRWNGGLRSWIFRVTIHEARMIRRSEHRHGRIVDALTLEPADRSPETPHRHLERTQTVQAVREALDILTPAQRSILRHDLDGSDIYTSEQGKRSLRYRARNELRRLFDRPQQNGCSKPGRPT